MKTLLVDGMWNLKKNYFKRKGFQSNGHPCGGSFGFLESLKSVISKVLPDRVIVFWDGFNAGKLRYEIYKPYKANRKKDWEAEYRILSSDGTESPEDKEKFELINQKLVINEFLQELCIRFLEVIYIEADDLIGQYILSSKIPNEEIIIYSRDKDFKQLVSSNVSLLNPDKLELVTIHNFKKIHGYPVENALFLQCFDGDDADKIEGVKGITSEALLKNFPLIAEEKYMYNRLVEECYNKKRNKKLKFYDTIINARSVLYRNERLMNLKRPFINNEVMIEMVEITYSVLDENRGMQNAMKLFIQHGFSKFVANEYMDLFFAPFYSIVNKEKEFSKNFKKQLL